MGPAVGFVAAFVVPALDQLMTAFGALAPVGAFRRTPIAVPSVAVVSVPALPFVPPIAAPTAILNDPPVFETSAIGLISPVRGGRLSIEH